MSTRPPPVAPREITEDQSLRVRRVERVRVKHPMGCDLELMRPKRPPDAAAHRVLEARERLHDQTINVLRMEPVVSDDSRPPVRPGTRLVFEAPRQLVGAMERALGGVEVDDLNPVADRSRLDDLPGNSDFGHEDVALLVLDAGILCDHGNDPPRPSAIARRLSDAAGHSFLSTPMVFKSPRAACVV
jgi:hypothetical protein